MTALIGYKWFLPTIKGYYEKQIQVQQLTSYTKLGHSSKTIRETIPDVC